MEAEIRRLRAALEQIRKLKRYSISQSIAIDPYPDALLRALDVDPIVEKALSGEPGNSVPEPPPAPASKDSICLECRMGGGAHKLTCSRAPKPRDQAPRLRMIEPFRMYGEIVAEVFGSKIGLPLTVALQFDTDKGDTADLTLTAVEAKDLMLWLQHALSGAGPASETNWQPIETAPKDGRTLLLGYYNSLGKWRSLHGQWFEQAEMDEWTSDDDGNPAGWYEISVENDDPPNCWATEPTHWQPTPRPPEKADDAP